MTKYLALCIPSIVGLSLRRSCSPRCAERQYAEHAFAHVARFSGVAVPLGSGELGGYRPSVEMEGGWGTQSHCPSPGGSLFPSWETEHISKLPDKMLKVQNSLGDDEDPELILRDKLVTGPV